MKLVLPGDKPPEKPVLQAWVWTCNGCGGSLFQLVQGGAVRCSHCNLYSTSVAHFDPRVPA